MGVLANAMMAPPNPMTVEAVAMRAAQPPAPPMTRDSFLASVLDPDIVQRGNLLPLGRDKAGELGFAVPQAGIELVRALMLPGDVARGVPFTESDVTDMALETAMLASPFGAAVPRGAIGMNAWHGGPNKWAPEPGFPQGRPRLDKIGTGEGAAAYGHGFYAAEAHGTGQSYKEMLAGEHAFKTADGTVLRPSEAPDEITKDAVRAISSMPPTAGIKWLRDTGQDDAASIAQKLFDEGGESFYDRSAGSLYKLDIPDDDVAKFLDWDAPLSQQSDHVKARLSTLAESNPELKRIMDKERGFGREWEGQDFYHALGGFDHANRAAKYNPEAASEALRRAGIPGNKYYDQMSRLSDNAAAMVEKSGSREAALEVARTRLNSVQRGDSFARAHWEKAVRDLESPQTRNYVIWDQDVLNRAKVLGSE